MKQFMAYLDSKADFYRQESRRLVEDDRRDEGDLSKIRANVYGICKSVFQVLDTPKAVCKLDGLRSEWETSLITAREHNDVKKGAVEEIKLETLAEIQAELQKER